MRTLERDVVLIADVGDHAEKYMCLFFTNHRRMSIKIGEKLCECDAPRTVDIDFIEQSR